ncbi:MAG TPA: ATP-binding protein [Gaiellaceae bacterium]|nr:ATP-binding protein [Gaiellaceae bacterium]
METVDAAAGRGVVSPVGTTLASELIARAAAIGAGGPRPTGTALLPPDVRSALRACEVRARRLADGWGQGAALDFLGDAIAAVAVAHRFEPGEARAAVTAAADELGVPPAAAAFAVFRRALASKEFAQLPPAGAAELALALLVELAPAAASSLWILDAGGSTTCLVSHGKAPRSRRLREVAKAALDGVIAGSPQVHVRVVERWDRPYAALVARGRGAESEDLDEYVEEAATAFAPLLERVSLFDRRVQREHDLVAAGERRLLRLGFDLHDGPLQEIVALADELRTASNQISAVVPDDFQQRVRGRFNDVHARLGALDESLRQIAHSIRSTTAVARPVADAVEGELLALESATGIEPDLHVEGDLSSLSDSQKIVLFRVVQEALSNVRKHSEAAKVSVVLRSRRTFVDLAVTDDGCGFDPRQLDAHRLGLAGISERVRLLGGAVEIETAPGGGTTVRATLPQWKPSTPAAATIYAATS